MHNTRQQHHPALLFVSGSDRERLVVLLVMVQRESSICVRPLAQVSIRHIKHAPAGRGPSESRLNERGRKATNRVFYPGRCGFPPLAHFLCSAIKTC